MIILLYILLSIILIFISIAVFAYAYRKKHPVGHSETIHLAIWINIFACITLTVHVKHTDIQVWFAKIEQ
jgi:hypothetical protein